MDHKLTRISAVLLLLLLLLGAGPAALADQGSEEPVCSDMRIYFDGLPTGRGYCLSGRASRPLEDLCAFLGKELSVYHDDGAGAYIVSANGLDMEAPDGCEYLYANKRYMYAPGGAAMIGGKFCLPVETAAKIFDLSYTLAEDLSRVDVNSSAMAILSGSSTYYSDTYGVEEVFWLARIIHAEAGNQPIEGRIGVGNVVLNRVESDIYPDTIFDVIFDNNVVCQFEPVIRGTVYTEPDELSTIAACLALEGFNTVGDSMYFVNPRYADDSWFRSSLTFNLTIGDHDFYT